jgi:predicted Zn-dependent protease
MDSRDNASVFLSRPHVITFGTIFLAGLRSDEGMISVLAHELMHIADGDNDSLRPLVAQSETRLRISPDWTFTVSAARRSPAT